MSKPYLLSNRKGLAPLEVILVLPVVAFLLVLIFYVAISCMQKYELVSLCRTQAWKARYHQRSPYHHQSSSIEAGKRKNLKVATAHKPTAPFQIRLGAGEIVSHGDGSQVNTGLFFDTWNTVKLQNKERQNIESKHVVLAYTWDHDEVNMDKPFSQIEKVLLMNTKIAGNTMDFWPLWNAIKKVLP